MRTWVIGLGMLVGFSTAALAADYCQPIYDKDDGEKVVAQWCSIPEPAPKVPTCQNVGRRHLLCDEPFGQALPERLVMPGNCKWVRGKLVCKDRG
jgi:hypothetical protein